MLTINVYNKYSHKMITTTNVCTRKCLQLQKFSTNVYNTKCLQQIFTTNVLHNKCLQQIFATNGHNECSQQMFETNYSPLESDLDSQFAARRKNFIVCCLHACVTSAMGLATRFQTDQLALCKGLRYSIKAVVG